MKTEFLLLCLFITTIKQLPSGGYKIMCRFHPLLTASLANMFSQQI